MTGRWIGIVSLITFLGIGMGWMQVLAQRLEVDPYEAQASFCQVTLRMNDPDWEQEDVGKLLLSGCMPEKCEGCGSFSDLSWWSKRRLIAGIFVI